MKNIVYLFVLLFSMNTIAQEERETPQITSTVKMGETIIIDEITTLQFVRVSADSRCPKGVTCVWAGELIFDLKITVNGKAEMKTVKFAGGSPAMPKMGSINDGDLFAISMAPEKINGKEIGLRDYELTFGIFSKQDEEKE